MKRQVSADTSHHPWLQATGPRPEDTYKQSAAREGWASEAAASLQTWEPIPCIVLSKVE